MKIFRTCALIIIAEKPARHEALRLHPVQRFAASAAGAAERSRSLGEVDHRSDELRQHAPSLLLGLRVGRRQEKPRRGPGRSGAAALQAVSPDAGQVSSDDERDH